MGFRDTCVHAHNVTSPLSPFRGASRRPLALSARSALPRRGRVPARSPPPFWRVAARGALSRAPCHAPRPPRSEALVVLARRLEEDLVAADVHPIVPLGVLRMHAMHVHGSAGCTCACMHGARRTCEPAMRARCRKTRRGASGRCAGGARRGRGTRRRRSRTSRRRRRGCAACLHTCSAHAIHVRRCTCACMHGAPSGVRRVPGCPVCICTLGAISSCASACSSFCVLRSSSARELQFCMFEIGGCSLYSGP